MLAVMIIKGCGKYSVNHRVFISRLAFQHIPVFLLYCQCNCLSYSSLATAFMFTAQELEELFIGLCLEGFFYGKISVLCALTCTLAKEVQPQLFSILGLYSAIFVIYLQCVSERSGTSGPIIIFYALCFLYFVSTVTIVGDLVNLILQVSNNSIFKNILFFSIV